LILNIAVGSLIYRLVSSGSTWISLILSVGVMALTCIAINFFIVLNKQERMFVFDAVKKKLKRS